MRTEVSTYRRETTESFEMVAGVANDPLDDLSQGDSMVSRG